MAKNTYPEIPETFQRADQGFVSYGVAEEGRHIPAPPYTIAAVARDRVVAGSPLDLSPIAPGHEAQVLEEYQDKYGVYGAGVEVSARRASEFARIGKQILELDEQGAIQPPLTDLEKQTIGHLVVTVWE